MEKNISMKSWDTKSMVLCAMFASLICVGAFIQIPGPFVNFTMQWFFVAMAGLLLGSKRGFMSVFSYVVIGLVGIPVFTKGGGPAYVLQPSFGYIVGFCIASYVIGKMTENKEKTFLKFFLANLVGIVIVYFIGFAHLYVIMTYFIGKSVAVSALFKSAVLLFVPTDIMYAVLAALIAQKVSKRIKL